MPRFEFDADFLLGDTLSGMGMTSAFDPAAADFSGMDGRSCLAGDPECLYVREVLHRGFVSVNEVGTEAAAATAMVIQTRPAKPEPVRVTVDRPFVFLVRDRGTGDDSVPGPGHGAVSSGVYPNGEPTLVIRTALVCAAALPWFAVFSGIFGLYFYILLAAELLLE